MLIDTEQMVAITQLQKELPRRIREVSKDGKPIYVLKNNEMEAVILSVGDFEYLSALSELLEYSEIEDSLKKRLKNYGRKNNISWEDLK